MGDVTGRIKREDIEAVRERAAVDDVVGEHVTLKGSGAGSLKGLCPFHDEKTPSFHVRPALGLWHCFGCGEGGDVISFIEKIHHLSFVQAVEYLAGRVGIVLHYEDESGQARPGIEPGTRQRLLEANRLAEQWFRAQLSPDNPAAAPAGRFLYGRGFDSDALAHFGVGFAPSEWDQLARYLRSHGFTEAELVASGLCVQSNSNTHRIYDRFRDRIMWPIRDVTGATIGFGGRRVNDDDPANPKYLNTPETAIYHKSSVLYGIDIAKKAIGTRHQVVVVEGYTDVMAAHLSGVTTAVATCGTAFGEGHVRIVRRLLGDAADPSAGVLMGRHARGGEVIFTFDGDEAGQKAALRAYGEDQHFAAQTFVAIDPRGYDPCDVRLEEGPEGIPRLLEHRQPLFEFVIRTCLNNIDLDTAEGRIRALRTAAPIVAGIRDRALRREYARRLAGWVALPEREVVYAVRHAERHPDRRQDEVNADTATPHAAAVLPPINDRISAVERQVLALMVQYPLVATEVQADTIDARSFSHPMHQAAFEAIQAAGGTMRMQEEVASLSAARQGSAGTERLAYARWVEQVRLGASGPIDAALTALAIVQLPVATRRHSDDIDPDALQRYAKDIVAELSRVGVNRRLTELRAKQRRLSPDDPDYRTVLKEIMGLENRRMQLAQR